MHASDITRFERRLYVFTFVRAVWFYLPVLVHHIVGELRDAGAEQPHTVAMSTLVIFSVAMLVAEYPSGVLADWAGRKRALALSCVLNLIGASIYVLSSSLLALFTGQFVFGLSAAFRSGSDSALLHSHLERAGVPERYSAALARLRIASNSGIVTGCFTGGLLYAWWPPAVFVGTALFSLAALVPLYSLEEPPRPTVHSGVKFSSYASSRSMLIAEKESVNMKKLNSICLSCLLLFLYTMLHILTSYSSDINWDKLFSGDIIVNPVSDKKGIPGVRLFMTVKAARERIWGTLTDYENFSNIFEAIDKIKVHKQDDQGAHVEFWIDAVFTKYHYILYRHYEKPQERLRWKRVSGDLERIKGSWEIRDTPRPGTKLLIYESYVKVTTAIPEFLMRWEAIRRARAMGQRLREVLEAPPSED